MPGPLTRPSLVDPNDPRVAVARFTIDVGDTESSRVDITGYMLRHLRFPSGVTATSFTIGVASSPTGQLFPVRDVLETSDYVVPVAAGKEAAVSFTVGLGAHPVVALVGNTAQTGSQVVIEATLVSL